jgi:NAD(P)-dependent dehydrogenase (short-subunit alcohol dehydrogenase family)
VVITGAAGGIGAALARRYAREGARLALLDLDGPGVEELAASLQAEGTSALGLPCDVTSLEACRTAIGRVCEEHGGVDVLVNNAGITHLSLFRETEVDVIRRVMEVNFFGSVNCTKAALESLLARRGQIIVLSSVAGFAPLAKRTGYSSSKFALHGFFETLRGEHRADGLRVMMACPWFVDTAIGERALDGRGGSSGDPRHDAGRPADPDAVADTIVEAALRDRRLVLVSGGAKLAWVVSRLVPRLYERLMLRRVFGR